MLGGLDIKGFVFSMIIVLMLVVGSASFLFVPMDDSSLVMDVAASMSEQANDTETIWLDAYASFFPTVYSQNPLANGTTYKITIEGTWGNWGSQAWYDADDPPVGPFEAAPMYPLGGGERTGPVGADPFWMFAIIFGEDYAQQGGNWPLPAKFGFRIYLGGDGDWDSTIRPIPDVYNPAHKYEVTVVGKGDIIGFKIWDRESDDNYGMLKIVIKPSSDADEDGLLDEWEREGIDSDDDGDIDLVLTGADWQHKDIFVEVDYMQGIMPGSLALNDVKIAFSQAPVLNPDMKTGINLHIELDQQCFYDPSTSWDEFDAIKKNYFGNYVIRADPNAEAILAAKKLVSHYCVFVDQLTEKDASNNTIYTKYSGMGECPGNDFIVSLGHIGGGDRMQQASVFMHELGHNLGLHHGGKDNINYKPNYLSIMNYMFQFNDIYPNRPLDYSGYELDTLNEAALNEMDGLGVDYVPAGSGGWLFTGYMDPVQNKTIPSLLRPIDWDGDNYFNDSVRANVNNCIDEDYHSPANETLSSFDDWGNLVLAFQDLPTYADKVHGNVPKEMTTDVMMLRMERAQSYHDVALVDATPSSTVIDQNGVLDVTVRSVNLGANNETTNLAVYAGTTLIAQRAVSLERSNITSTTLRCDASVVPSGDRVITIRLAQVPGEEDAIDNDFTYGTIEFTGEAAPPPTDQSWPLILGVSLALVAVIAIALFVVLRKRGKKNV